ncbi:glycoside hydrolase family 2 protein [Seonamhaeicola sp.]|uniref:glycoside hydrolase family 2 protein n=1 Tax=Seonamhaeicola sp. TaxID=1912245 RepID=UPI0035670F12
MRIIFYSLTIFIIFYQTAYAQVNKKLPEFSKAGFYEVPKSGRDVFDFNVGWRFYKGSIENAELKDFDDSKWDIVNTPHGIELLSTQASGSNNYQGEVWYRKHFKISENIENKRLTIYFEAIMGKCKVWLNGELLKSHYGGFLPFNVDISNKIIKGEDNIITVWADNSDDITYPPGKSQKQLDFSYFGGIYRDVWLVATNNIYITNSNRVDKIAGGGTFIHYENLSEKNVDVVVQIDVANGNSLNQKVTIQYILKNFDGTFVSKNEKVANISAKSSKQINYTFKVDKPKLWSPKNPNLYNLELRVLKNNKTIDGVRHKIGIRKIEFKGKEGLYLNNKPYQGKLIGVNRHQDFAYVGNALPNSGQWRDAVILKEAGCEIVRAAHYPADPAFMDACDELGLFFIVATPGWQFWNNKDASFEKYVYKDIRNMVRRDRNYASVLLWEPILNETNYPDYFAKKVHDIVHEEYPFSGAYTVCDVHAKGQQYFDVIYSHPYKGMFYNNPVKNTIENQKKFQFEYDKEERSVFTREWGDSVDDWNSHNSPSRAARSWGEHAQLIQAQHYAQPSFVYTSWESLYNTPAQHVGGALWHSFDHQRGYHPDPFYGGITDVFRQPKYSYQIFKSQRTPKESEPMIYIANEMTPFSPSDVNVLTNCDEVRLIMYEKDTLILKQDRSRFKMPSPIVVFKDVFDFIDIKALHRQNKKQKANIVAEGLIDGKVVVRERKWAALRTSHIKLELADKNIPLVANGSDMVTIIASIVDENGTVKRLNNDVIKFEIKGEGNIVGDSKIMANPIKVAWGTAPAIIKSTTKPGVITVKASILKEGAHTPSYGELTFTSIPSVTPLLYSDISNNKMSNINNVSSNNKEDEEVEKNLKKRILELEKEINNLKLKEVEKQQLEFEGIRKQK